MAKISKINIAITGDSKGLAAATDAATKELRRLEAQAEKTNRNLGAQRKTINLTADAMSRLGASSKTLGALSGVLGIGQILGTGGAVGAGAVAVGASLAGIGATIAISQQIAAITSRAQKAIDETAMDARKRIEASGFSKALADAITRNGLPTTAGQNLGIWDSLVAGLAATRSGNVGGNVLASFVPGAATGVGTMLGGGGFSKAGTLATSQMMSGNAVQDATLGMHMSLAANNPMGPVGYLFQLMMGD
jgi:hypothetical protein